MLSRPIPRLSRRACLARLAALPLATAALASFPAPVLAQRKHEYKFDPANLAWRAYRRDDFRFHLDMPADPAIDENPEPKEMTAEVMFDRVTFGVVVKESASVMVPTFPG